MEFPDDLFTQSQRQHVRENLCRSHKLLNPSFFQGAILFHLLASIYIFIAIAIVVDDYFIAALDKLCAVHAPLIIFIHLLFMDFSRH